AYRSAIGTVRALESSIGRRIQAVSSRCATCCCKEIRARHQAQDFLDESSGVYRGTESVPWSRIHHRGSTGTIRSRAKWRAIGLYVSENTEASKSTERIGSSGRIEVWRNGVAIK